MEQKLREELFEALLGDEKQLAAIPALRDAITQDIDSIAPIFDRRDAHLEEVLTVHFLSHIICEHDSRRDKTACACGWVSESEPSVGHAVRAWAKHAIAKL